MKLLAFVFCFLLERTAAQPDLAVNLKTGTSDPATLPTGFEWVSPLTSPEDDDCNGQAVLKATFNEDDRRRLEINLGYCSSGPEGLTLDVGDSETSTGEGSESSSTGNNAEFVIKDDTIFLYGRRLANDEYSWSRLHERRNFVTSGSRLIINVSDGKVTADSGSSSTVLQTFRAFALSGQPDLQGETDYDIYIGLNRAVASNENSGSGLCAAYFTWQEEP